ncbi:hypothetical protein ACF0H5_009471 [Mactra antiquata]
MRTLVLLASVVAVVYGANHLCWSVDQISDEVIKLADANADGIVSYSELSDELLNDWNLSNDSCLSFHDFTTNWNLHFHDHHDTAHQFFHNLDLNGDRQLCLIDVAVQIITYDDNPTDGQIQPVEMNAFLHAVHPDSHKNGGHGNGC